MAQQREFGLSRRGLIGSAALVALAASVPVRAAGVAPRFELIPRPTRVFKTADRGHENTESWIFSLIVQSASPEALTPAAMTVELLKAGAVVRTTQYPAAGFAPLTYHTGFAPALNDGSASPTPIYWPFLIRLRQTEPVALGVDAMRIAVAAEDAKGGRSTAALTVAIETYVQKTALVFPFRGKGIVLQGGATNGGHRNRSGAFALDAMGLDAAWSVQAPGDGKTNTDYPGFGRTLIAPADGVVVRARGDRPDQPVGDASDPAFFAPEFVKQGGGDPGNHVVIDHGRDEFSMIAHFMAGSLLVKAGDAVKQGQALGRLGHSGDTNAPHCHYQLQAGPDWQNADALPVRFTNVDQAILDRGTYFEAT
ncbi:MAG TPA: M23 family metallopeptidase [Rhizomicrobium sp.]|jgi:hypothetical protein|nr:M23 family metallopeptidase [Rhizomicrobium sp.]